MKLLKLEGDLRAYPTPEVAELRPFRDLIRRDRGSPGDSQGRKKQKASRELAYIFHLHSHESSFSKYDSSLREEKVREALFPEDWEWERDELLEEVEEAYLELTETSLIRLLNAAESSIHQLTAYFNRVRLVPGEDEEEGFEPPDSAKDVIANLKNVKDVVSSLRKLREEVEKEQAGGTRLRGDVQTNQFSD